MRGDGGHVARAGVGVSREGDAFAAGREAALRAVEQADGAAPVVSWVYATVLHDHAELLRGVRSVVDGPIVGCTTQGLSRPGGIDDLPRAVGVAVLGGDGVEARVARVTGVRGDSADAGRRLAEALDTPSDPRCPLLVWYDPLFGADGQALIDGLARGGHPWVVGGGAGQRWGPHHRTCQFFDEQVLTDAIVGVQLRGVEMLLGLTHGTEALDMALTVTGSRGNLVTELDGQPALDLWEHELQGSTLNDMEHAASWAFGLPTDGQVEVDGPVTRAVVGFDPAHRALILQAPIAPGTRVRICHRTAAATVQRAVQMARRVADRLEGRPPLLALAFECAGRSRPFLGPELAAREIVDMQRAIGADVPWLGYLAWGELAPVGARTRFHNYTFPLAVLVAA